jgi:TATA-binding protein-associated factor Taf7
MEHEMDSKLLQQLIEEMDSADLDSGKPEDKSEEHPHGATVVEITVHPVKSSEEHAKEEKAEPEDEELPESLKDLI